MPGWTPLGLIASWYAVLSAVSAATYAIDKRRAVRNRSGAGLRRVPERTLHGLDLLGGWPGGLAARRLFRHKRDKRVKGRFVWTSRAIVAVHVAAWVIAAALWIRFAAQ